MANWQKGLHRDHPLAKAIKLDLIRFSKISNIELWKGEMENSLRNADSGLDLDDSASGNETFHSSDGGNLNRNDNNNTLQSQRGN